MPVINETINVIAYLRTVIWCELGQAVIDGSDQGYNVLATSTPGNVKTFPSYASHPHMLMAYTNAKGEPVKQPDGTPLISSAAGAYQMLYANWERLQQLLHLPDFGKWSQDRMAIQLIKEAGAYDLIQRGAFLQATARCCKVWASLPGSPYGQPTHTVATVQNIYTAAGGCIT